MKKRSRRVSKGNLNRASRLEKNPFKKGMVVRVKIRRPKKPNSAMRHVARVRLTNKRKAICRIPGKGYGLSRYNRVLVRGGRANDLPGVGYSVVRGTLDCSGVVIKKRRRSFYGVR